MAIEAKEKRLQLRTTASEDALLRRAAERENKNLSEFVLGSAFSNAENVLADQRWFVLGEDEFEAFEEALDSPIETNLLIALLQAETPFEKEFHVGQ